jgi:sec-independent protein translocase protein TatB
MQPTIEIASLGMADSLILMVLALVVFGPRRLPQIGRQMGKLMYEFRKASNDFKFQMEEELRNAEEADRRKKEEAERERTLALTAPAAQTEGTGAISQAPETGAGAPLADASAATGTAASVSPDPYEYIYPDSYAEGMQVRESYPRIQPPSTGEPVAASRPGNATGEAETAEESRVATGLEAGGDAASETASATTPSAAAVAGEIPQEKGAAVDGSAATEQAARHG